MSTEGSDDPRMANAAVERSGDGQAIPTDTADGSSTTVPVATGAEGYSYIGLVEPAIELQQRAAGGEGRV
jgi:hypothetical protein